MKDYEVIALQNDGELICENCIKEGKEWDAFYNEGEIDNMSIVFAGNVSQDDICTRCNCKLIEDFS